MKSNSLQQQVSNSSPQKQNSTYQSAEEVQEMLLQELENLFDKPSFVSVQTQQNNDTPTSRGQQQQNPQQQTTTIKILFEKDYTNTFLITNPMAIFKVFAKDQFLGLPETTQCILLERLEDILQKCSHNSLILTEHVFQQNIMRINQQVIEQLAQKTKQTQQSSIELQGSKRNSSSKSVQSGEKDLILLIIQLALKVSNKNYQTSRKLIDVLRKLTSGKRFNRCHQEYIYQYLKVKTTEKCKDGKGEEAMMKIEAAIKMISSMYEQRFDLGPSNYFYFSGYLSGIQGFAAAMWFQLQDTTIQDDKNLPVLFNCFFQGYGGFECYFNQKKLFYRILPKAYSPPSKQQYQSQFLLDVESNGVQIGEFQSKKWYYFAIDHEKPFMTRPQFTAIINDKQVVTLPMDYPKIDKGAKISMIAICKNFIGQLSSFLLFKEQISNTKKLIQMFNHYEYGLHNNQLLHKLNPEIFDAKLASKLFILYCPERVSQKIIYDSIEMRDGELMINSGASHSGPKSKLFFNGGLNSFLPLLELVQGVTIYAEDQKNNLINIADIVNEYLKLVISILSTKSFVQYEAENLNFFSVLFYLLGKLPNNSVNNQTISNLADIRFLIGDSKLQEQFFQSLMQSSDFWINTDNMEVLNEYWLFVKAIYQQNPIQYNKMFSIQKLIDLMVKISDIKDGHCCEYHRDTYLMFYQGIIQQHQPQPWVMAGGKDRSNSQLVNDDKKLLGFPAKHNSDLDKYNQSSQRQNNQNPFKPASDIVAQPGQSSKIHHLEKYLAPIAGVLEGVLTSGGNEVLDQIQYIAKALTVKSSPCFHLQMLKLLKVLLLDSKEDRHCASPADFAAHLLKCKGLQILLYLCSNSSFDVKSMCVKLIDVLSSHTSLIKMAIDPDVITYLCNIILPRQMMDVASLSQKNQMFKSNIESNQKMIEPTSQYQMVEELDEESQEDLQLNQSKDLEDHIDQLLMGQTVDTQQQYQQQKKFGRGLFLEDEDDERNQQKKEQYPENDQDEAQEIQPKGRFVTKNNKVSMGGFIKELEENNDFQFEDRQSKNPFENIKQLKKKGNKVSEEGYDEELLCSKPPPPAPKSKAKPFSFDFDEDDSNTMDKPDKKFNQTSKNLRFGKQQQQQIDELEEEGNSDNESEEQATSSSQPKDFGIIGFKKVNSAQAALDPKKKFMNTQKLPTLGGKQASTGMKQGVKGRSIGLELDIEEDKFNEKVAAATRGARNTFSGGFQRKEIEFAEIDDDDEEQNEDENNFASLGGGNKKGKKETFANENVMSKSNLRQPKSFNFGFPAEDASDEDEEEEKTPIDNDDNEIIIQHNEEDEIYFQDEFFKAHRGKNTDVTQEGSFGAKSANQPKLHRRNKSDVSPTKLPKEQERLDQEEEKQKPQIAQAQNSKMPKRNLVIGGTTGATSDTLQEKSHSRERFEEEEKINAKKTQPKKAVISFQKKSKLFTNANQKLNIDTEAINELFNYGGEKGQIMMTEDEELLNLEKDIEELASMCLAAMNRKRPEDPIKYEGKREKTSFETKYLKGDPKSSENVKSKNPRQQFMTPQSVRGIKKIEFSMSQEEKLAALEGSKDKLNLGSSLGSSGLLTSKAGFGLKTGAFSGGIIQEELSPGNTSKSSSKHDFNNFGLQTQSSGGNNDHSHHDSQIGLQSRKSKQSVTHKTASTNELPLIHELDDIIGGHGHHQSDSGLKRRLSDTDAHLESSYENKLNPFSQMDSGKVDEYTIELENLYTSCLEWIISRAPSNLYENIVIDECDKVGYQPAIQLMMTLVMYSNNIIRQRALNDLEMLAKWDSNNGAQIMTHPQFHTWLLELLMPYQDLASKYSKLQGTSRAVYDIGCKLHTLLLKNACINQEEEAYKKINFLSRWPQIVGIQSKQGIKDRTERDIETAHKLSRVLLTQLINSLKDEAQRMKPQNSKLISTAWHNLVYITYLIEEMVVGNSQKEMQGNDDQETYGEYNTQLFKWIQKEYLLYYYGSNESSLWAEWDMIEQVFQILDIIFPEWTMKQVSSSSRTPLSLDESIFQLLQKCSGDEFSAVVEILLHDGSPYKQSANSQVVQNQGNVQKQSKKGKGIIGNVLAGTSPLGIHFKSGNQSLSGPESVTSPQGQSGKGENSFMKIILNLICVALTQADTKQLVQLWLDRFERFIKYIMIVSETWKSRLVNTVYNQYQVKFSETITFAFTFLFHELHASQRVSTPTQQQNAYLGQTQFSSQSSPKDQKFNKLYAQSLKNLMIYFINIVEYSRIKYTPNQLETHITACRNIFHNYLIKTNYQNQSESLITFKDIARFKQSEYDDFPECFYLDDWKITFFYSETIKKIIKKQMNLETLRYYIHKRISYSQHYMETQMSNDKTKDDILRRMQCDTVDVIGLISEEEFERKNKVALMNDNFIREQGYFWNKAKKLLFGPKGIWRNIGEQYLKANLFRSNEGVKTVMSERYSNGFEFQESISELERKIFNEIDNSNCEMFMISKKQIQEVKAILSEQRKQKQKNLQINSEPANSEDRGISGQGQNSDDEDDEQEEEDDNEAPSQTHLKDHIIIQFFSRQLTTREKISLKKQYIAHLKEYIYTFRPKNKEIVELKCQILKPFYQRPGTIVLTSHDIIFFDDLYTPATQIAEKDNIFFFKYQKKNDEILYKIIGLPNLKEIQRRRWLGRKTALELFLMDGKTLMINFQSQDDREVFAKKIIRQRNQKCFNLRYYDTLDPRRILKKRELTEKWSQWKISNFEYIMQLNQLSGRSYNDLSQYPVFPWIIVDNQSPTLPDINNYTLQTGGVPPNGLRDLNKNMQLLGSAERQAEFKRKFDDSDSFSSLQEKFHCGSHYSNPGIVLHYLSRLSPFLDALVELHGKNLDTPDRGFHSVQESLVSALGDHSDVRELIPEFYFSPEIFMNMNKIKFGVKQDGTIVDNVMLPEWCNNDPYFYVVFLREAFESHYVSQNLGGWIDYIFGYKQRDAEAEKSLNVFSRLTYEDGIDIDTVADQFLKQGYQEQIYHYGQTPSQLFQKSKHPQKLPKQQVIKYSTVVDNNSKIKVYKPVTQTQAAKNQQVQTASQIVLTQEAILKAKFVDEQTIIGLSKDGTVTYFFWLSKAHELNPNTPFTCCEDKKRKFDNKSKYNDIEAHDRSIKKFDFPLLILHQSKCIMRGGFWGGKIAICPIEGISSEPQSSLQVHQSTVTVLVATLNEKTVISGSKNGDVIVWNYIGGAGNPNNEVNWQVRKHMCDHDGIISMIYINEEMCMYITCSHDGTANLYNLWTDKIIRTFKHPKLAPIHSAVLSQAPLPTITFFSREDHYWYSFSLNGHYLEKQKEECGHIISPIVLKDSHFMEKLVYGTEKGYIIFRTLPALKQIKKQQVSTSYPVCSVIASSDRRFMLVGCGDGGLNVVTEPFQQSGFSSGAGSSQTHQTVGSQQFIQTQQITQQSLITQNVGSGKNFQTSSSHYRE